MAKHVVILGDLNEEQVWELLSISRLWDSFYSEREGGSSLFHHTSSALDGWVDDAD